MSQPVTPGSERERGGGGERERVGDGETEGERENEGERVAWCAGLSWASPKKSPRHNPTIQPTQQTPCQTSPDTLPFTSILSCNTHANPSFLLTRVLIHPSNPPTPTPTPPAGKKFCLKIKGGKSTLLMLPFCSAASAACLQTFSLAA